MPASRSSTLACVQRPALCSQLQTAGSHAAIRNTCAALGACAILLMHAALASQGKDWNAQLKLGNPHFYGECPAHLTSPSQSPSHRPDSPPLTPDTTLTVLISPLPPSSHHTHNLPHIILNVPLTSPHNPPHITVCLTSPSQSSSYHPHSLPHIMLTVPLITLTVPLTSPSQPPSHHITVPLTSPHSPPHITLVKEGHWVQPTGMQAYMLQHSAHLRGLGVVVMFALRGLQTWSHSGGLQQDGGQAHHVLVWKQSTHP